MQNLVRSPLFFCMRKISREFKRRIISQITINNIDIKPIMPDNVVFTN